MPEDVEGTCDHYGEVIVGVPPNCECKLIWEVEDYYSSGTADVQLGLPSGWTLDSLSGSVDAVSLASLSNPLAGPVTSQALSITNQARQGNTLRLWLGGADETFLGVSDESQLRYVLESTNLVVHATKPNGQSVNLPFPDAVEFPVSMSDDCTDRNLDGTESYGALTVSVTSTFDSPGC